MIRTLYLKRLVVLHAVLFIFYILVLMLVFFLADISEMEFTSEEIEELLAKTLGEFFFFFLNLKYMHFSNYSTICMEFACSLYASVSL